MLPPDLGTALLASLDLHPDVRGLAKLEDRVDWLAARLHRDARTARRRMDEAAAMLAENLSSGRHARRTALPSTGWHIVTAQSALVLDTGVPTSVERRIVVAEHDGLDQLVLARSVPPAADGRPEVHAQMIFGGVLGLKEWETGTRFRLVLELPATLRTGDRHEYAILWRQPPDQPMRPYYVFTRCCGWTTSTCTSGSTGTGPRPRCTGSRTRSTATSTKRRSSATGWSWTARARFTWSSGTWPRATATAPAGTEPAGSHPRAGRSSSGP